MKPSATPEIQSPRPLSRDLLWYTAAAGAVGALAAPAADAQVVYNDPEDLFVENTDTSGDGAFTGLSLDFDGDGDNEILFFERDTDNYPRFAFDVDPSDGPDAVAGALGELVPFQGGGNYLYPYPLAAGAAIGPAPSLITAPYTYGTFTFNGSDPQGWIGTDAYMGIQFTLDGAATHYGWVRVEVPAQGGAIIVKEFAYEATPDTPIQAGDTGVAAEPGPGPITHALSAVQPNPFGAEARFTLQLAEAQRVRVAVFDGLGREVAALHDGPLAAGAAHVFALDGAALPGGVYVVRAVGQTFSDARRVSLVK